MGSPQRCQVPRPEGLGLGVGVGITFCPAMPYPAAPTLNESSSEGAQPCSPPGDATCTLYSSTGFWGGFQCSRADPSVKFNARSWVGPSETGGNGELRGIPAALPTSALPAPLPPCSLAVRAPGSPLALFTLTKPLFSLSLPLMVLGAVLPTCSEEACERLTLLKATDRDHGHLVASVWAQPLEDLGLGPAVHYHTLWLAYKHGWG